MSRIHHLNRFLAGVIAVTFFVTNTLTPAPIAHAMPAGRQAQGVEAPSFVSSFKIPDAFGRVHEIIPAASQASVLIHIQEAHANYDAQKNIRGILQHLSRDYGVDLVLMEGAGYKLEPKLFRFFPTDAKLQHEANRKLMEAGELTGAEVFLMDAPRGAEGRGMENAAAYRKDREAFKTVFKGREIENAFLDEAYLRWQSQAASVLNKDLRDFLNRYVAYESEQSPLADWLEVLKKEAFSSLNLDLSDAAAQVAWPTLVRYFRLKKIGAEIDLARSETEKKKFFAETGLPFSMVGEVEQVFASAKTGSLPLYETRFIFERMMDALPKAFSFSDYPNFRLHIQQMVLMSELQGEALQQEVRGLSKMIVATIAKTESERRHVALLREYLLLKKLFHLELSREEYQQVVARKIVPEHLAAEVSPALQTLYQAALEFYAGAIRREDFMMEKALARMKERKRTKAVLITGGFHTDGLKERITRSGNAYIGITPRMGEIPADSQKNYLSALLGQELIGKSHIAPEVRSEMRFWQETSPRTWRRDFAAAGARVAGIVQQVSPEGVAAVRRNFITAAASFRSESREVTASGRVLAEGEDGTAGLQLLAVDRARVKQREEDLKTLTSREAGLDDEVPTAVVDQLYRSGSRAGFFKVALALVIIGFAGVFAYIVHWEKMQRRGATPPRQSGRVESSDRVRRGDCSQTLLYDGLSMSLGPKTSWDTIIFSLKNVSSKPVSVEKMELFAFDKEEQPSVSMSEEPVGEFRVLKPGGAMDLKIYAGFAGMRGLVGSFEKVPEIAYVRVTYGNGHQALFVLSGLTRMWEQKMKAVIEPKEGSSRSESRENEENITDFKTYVYALLEDPIFRPIAFGPNFFLTEKHKIILRHRSPFQVEDFLDYAAMGALIGLAASTTRQYESYAIKRVWGLHRYLLEKEEERAVRAVSTKKRSEMRNVGVLLRKGAGQKGTLYVDHIPVTPDIATVNSVANGTSVTFKSFAGASYKIQYKNDLSDPAWYDAETVKAAGPQTTWTDDGSKTKGLSAKRFYRVVYSRSESRSLDDAIIPYLEAYGRFAGRENSHRGWQESMEALGGYDAIWSIFHDEILTAAERDIVAKMMAYGRGYAFRGWEDMSGSQKHAMLAGWKSVGIEIPEKLKRDTDLFNRFMLGMLGAMGIWWPVEASLQAVFPELTGVGAQALSLSLSTAIIFGLLCLNDLSTARAVAQKQRSKLVAEQAATSSVQRSESRQIFEGAPIAKAEWDRLMNQTPALREARKAFSSSRGSLEGMNRRQFLAGAMMFPLAGILGGCVPQGERRTVTVFVVDKFNKKMKFDPSQGGYGVTIPHGEIVTEALLLEAPGADVRRLDITDPEGEFSSTLYYDALERIAKYAANRPKVPVLVNISLGGYKRDKIEETLIQELRDAGVAVVAAAGNETTTRDCYPAAFPGVISVAAATKSGRTKYSNSGWTVSIAAEETLSVAQGGTIFSERVKASGTSVVAPRVAGALARLLMKDKTLSLQQAWEIVQKTAKPIKSSGVGVGLLDVGAALHSIEKKTEAMIKVEKYGKIAGILGLIFSVIQFAKEKNDPTDFFKTTLILVAILGVSIPVLATAAWYIYQADHTPSITWTAVILFGMIASGRLFRNVFFPPPPPAPSPSWASTPVSQPTSQDPEIKTLEFVVARVVFAAEKSYENPSDPTKTAAFFGSWVVLDAQGNGVSLEKKMVVVKSDGSLDDTPPYSIGQVVRFQIRTSRSEARELPVLFKNTEELDAFLQTYRRQFDARERSILTHRTKMEGGKVWSDTRLFKELGLESDYGVRLAQVKVIAKARYLLARNSKLKNPEGATLQDVFDEIRYMQGAGHSASLLESALKAEEVADLNELCRKTRQEILGYDHVGRGVVADLEVALTVYGRKFETKEIAGLDTEQDLHSALLKVASVLAGGPSPARRAAEAVLALENTKALKILTELFGLPVSLTAGSVPVSMTLGSLAAALLFEASRAKEKPVDGNGSEEPLQRSESRERYEIALAGLEAVKNGAFDNRHREEAARLQTKLNRPDWKLKALNNAEAFLAGLKSRSESRQVFVQEISGHKLDLVIDGKSTVVANRDDLFKELAMLLPAGVTIKTDPHDAKNIVLNGAKIRWNDTGILEDALNQLMGTRSEMRDSAGRRSVLRSAREKASLALAFAAMSLVAGAFLATALVIAAALVVGGFFVSKRTAPVRRSEPKVTEIPNAALSAFDTWTHEDRTSRERSELRGEKEIEKPAILLGDLTALLNPYLEQSKEITGYDLGFRVTGPTGVSGEASTALVTSILRGMFQEKAVQFERLNPMPKELTKRWEVSDLSRRPKRDLVTIVEPAFKDLSAMIRTAKELVSEKGLIVVSLRKLDMDALLGNGGFRGENTFESIQKVLVDFRLVRLLARGKRPASLRDATIPEWPINSSEGAFVLIYSPRGTNILGAPNNPEPAFSLADVPVAVGARRVLRSETRELIDLMVMPAMVLGVIGIATFISRHWKRTHNLKKNRVVYKKYREAVMDLDPEDPEDQQVLYALRWLLTKRQPPMRVIQDPGDQKRYKLWVEALAKATDAASVKAVLASLVVERRPKLADHPEGIFFVEEVFEYVPITKIVLDILEAGDSKFMGFSAFLKDVEGKPRWEIDSNGHQLRFEAFSEKPAILSRVSEKKIFPSLKRVLVAVDKSGEGAFRELFRDLAPNAKVTFVEITDQGRGELWKNLKKGSYDLIVLDGDVIPRDEWDLWMTDVLTGVSAGQSLTPLALLTARLDGPGIKTKIWDGVISGTLEKPQETFLDWDGKHFYKLTAQHAKSLSDILEKEGIRSSARSESRKMAQELGWDETLVFGAGEFRLVVDSPYEAGVYVLLQSQKTDISVDGKMAPKVPAQGLSLNLTVQTPLIISRGKEEIPARISLKKTEGSRVFLEADIPEDMNLTVLDASYRERKDRREIPTFMGIVPRDTTLSDAEVVLGSSRSESRAWAKKPAELEEYTVISRQLEAGLSRDILDRLIRKFGKTIAGLVAATTVTGGLGALMHDLFPSWQKNFGKPKAKAYDAFTVNVIYDEIKGQRFAKDVPAEVREGKRTLGDYLRDVLNEDPSLRLETFMEPGSEYRSSAEEWISRAEGIIADIDGRISGSGDANARAGMEAQKKDWTLYRKRLQQAREASDREIRIKVYPTETSVGGMPNFYVEAFYIDEYGAKVQIFDEVYPDAPYGGPNLWRDLQMAVYGRITELLTLKLQEKGFAKKKILFVDNEVFVSIPTPLLPDALHHHMNHSVFEPTIYGPAAVSAKLLGYAVSLWRYIVQKGKISVVKAIGMIFDMITGVALYEHTPAVAGGVAPGYVDIVDSYNEDGLRSTNGVLFEQWQSPFLRSLIDSYKRKLGMAGVDDRDFFAQLNEPAHKAVLGEFQERFDVIKAYLTGRLMLWLKQSQNRPAWYDEAMEAYRRELGMESVDDAAVLGDLYQAIQVALVNEDAWKDVLADAKIQILRREFLKTAIVSNVRRQVSYKGPDKWREILYSLKADPAKLAWYKKHAARAVLGGREFGQDAHDVFLEIQGLVRELGLEDKFATIENYNIEVAPIIFQGDSATVMITYEVLEASATSMMKGLPNGAVLIMAWGGAGPELFTIVETATGREVDIFKEHVTYEQLVKNLHSKDWKITNGYLVEYSETGDRKFVLNTLDAAGNIVEVNARYPMAHSMIEALTNLQGRFQVPAERMDLEWEALRSSPLVDMEKSQARAHMKLWQKVVQKKEKRQAIFAQDQLSPGQALQFLSQSEKEGRAGFVWRTEKPEPLELAGPRVLDFIESSRQLRTHAAEGYRSVAYHAVRGDIFGKIFFYLDPFKESLPALYQEMVELKVQSESSTNLLEKVRGNLAALRLLDQFAAQLSQKILQGYLASQGEGYKKLFQSALFRQNLYFYLDSKGQKFGSLNQNLAGFAVEESGEKYIVALNLGEPKYPGVEGGEPKAWGQFYGEKVFEWLTGQTDPEAKMAYEVSDVITGEIYGDGEDRKPYPFWALSRGALPIGVPEPDIQILRLRPTGEIASQGPQKKSQEMFIFDDLRALVSGDPKDQVRQQKPRSYWLKKTLIYLLRNNPADLKARLKNISDMGRDKAIASFGIEGVRPVMAFIAGLIPEFLEDMRDWDPEVYNSLKTIMADPEMKDLFEKGDIFLNDASRDSAVVITRTVTERVDGTEQKRHVVIPIHFAKTPYNKEEGKVWFGFGSISRLGLLSGTIYKTRDWAANTVYEREHTLASLSKEGWRVGVPVVKRKDPAGVQQSGWRFQVLQMIPVGMTRTEGMGETGFSARSESRDNPSEGPTPLVTALLGVALEGVVAWGEHMAVSLKHQKEIVLGKEKFRASRRSESRLGEADISRVEAALQHVMATSTDAGERKTAELFLQTGLVSHGRKGFEELNRADSFLKSLHRSEARKLDASDVTVTRERGALHIVVGEASTDVTTLTWEEGHEPGKVAAAFLTAQGLNARVSDKSSSEVIIGGHPVFLDWEKREEFHLWELRDAIVREVQRQNARSESRAVDAWPQHKNEKIAVVGAAGFVGATEASMLSARFGHDVAGVDVKTESVASLNGGKLVNYAPGLEAFLQDGLNAKRLSFTTKLAEAIEGREFVFLALPTPYLPNGQSDTHFLEDAIGDIAKLMKPGERKIVIGKSTAPPSTIDKLKARIKQVGLPDGAEIELAWIPEFLREGLEVEDALGGSGRMVIGAEKPAIADRVASLYARGNINPKYPGKPIPIIKMGIRSAMLVKYGANGYRATKISFSNAVSWLTAALGFDINEISDRVGADPRIRRSFLSAGIGWGGSCFPKDSLSFMRQLVESGMPYGLMLDTFMVNELQWESFAEAIKDRLDGVKDKTIVILGGAFKPETSDDRESRANLIIRRLVEWGAKVRVFDPEAIPFLKRSLVDLNTVPESGKESPVTYYSDPSELYSMMEGTQAIALVTEWGIFREINFKKVQQMFPEKRPLVFDGRNAWDPEEVKGFGFEYFGISHTKAPSSFVGGPAALIRSQDEFAAKMVEFFLALRIAFVNSLAELAERAGADIRDVLKGLGADPVVGDAYLKPGIGFGGFDLFAALEKVAKLAGLSHDGLREMMQQYRNGLSTMKRHFGFPETVDESQKVPYVSPILEGNDRAIALHVEKAREAVGGDLKGKQIAILGMAYKPGETSSIENAPSLKLIEMLRAQGAIARVTDAHPVTGASVRNYFAAHAVGMEGIQFFDHQAKNAVENAREAVRGSDAQILVTEWPEYANWKEIFFEKGAAKKATPVTAHLNIVDGRHFYDPAEMTANGFRYLAVGIPTQQEAKTVVLPGEEKESLGRSIQFPEKAVRIESLGQGRFKASLRLDLTAETLASTSFYVHFGPRAKGAFVPPWHDKEIAAEQIALLEKSRYELTAELDANEFPQFASGEFGATFFALPSDITEQDAGYYTDRVWVKQYGQVDDGVFQASPRSESRSFFHPEWITGQRMSVMTLEGFFRFNKEQQAGGSEKAVRSFSDKVMDGLYPLLANTLNVIEKILPAVAQHDRVKTIHAKAAKRVVGLVPDGSYAFILGSDLALAKDKGMLALAKTIYSGSSFALLEKDPAKIPAIKKFLETEGLLGRVDVFKTAFDAAAFIKKSGVSSKAMISSEELMLAEEIEKALNDKPIVMNESIRKRFLNAAGQLFQSLADRIAGQFALARSA